MEEYEKEKFVEAVLAVTEEHNASTDDLRAVVKVLKTAEDVDGRMKIDTSSLSAFQCELVTKLFKSTFKFPFEVEQTARDAGSTSIVVSSNESRVRKTHQPIIAVNAARALLFVMSEDEAEARVGDCLEQLARVQRKYGHQYGLIHFWWTILNFLLMAIWEKTPVKKLIDLSVEKWKGN